MRRRQKPHRANWLKMQPVSRHPPTQNGMPKLYVVRQHIIIKMRYIATLQTTYKERTATPKEITNMYTYHRSRKPPRSATLICHTIKIAHTTTRLGSVAVQLLCNSIHVASTVQKNNHSRSTRNIRLVFRGQVAKPEHETRHSETRHQTQAMHCYADDRKRQNQHRR